MTTNLIRCIWNRLVIKILNIIIRNNRNNRKLYQFADKYKII